MNEYESRYFWEPGLWDTIKVNHEFTGFEFAGWWPESHLDQIKIQDNGKA